MLEAKSIDYSTTPTTLTEEERIVGKKTYELFFGKPGGRAALADAPTWSVTNDRVMIMERVPDTNPPLFRPKDISAGLENERISERAAMIIATEDLVEGQHPDYTRVAKDRTRNYRGLNCYYDFWGLQEATHSVVLTKILMDTGARTAAQIEENRAINDLNIWHEPYETVLTMLAYANRQEFKTKINYIRTATLLAQEGAPIAAGLVRRLASQEGGHERAFHMFLGIYAELDREMVRQAILRVEETFRMPIQNLIPNPRRNAMGFYRARINTPLLDVQDSFRYLSKSGFFTEEEAEKEAARCFI